MENNFNYQEVPGAYLHCLHAECPRSATCLRFLVTLHADPHTLCFSVINPAFIAEQVECPYFQVDELTRFALGMSHLLDNQVHSKALKLRKVLYSYFGRSMFYRIRNKERLITPEEQAFIREIFRKEGIEEEPVFDQYVYRYQWF